MGHTDTSFYREYVSQCVRVGQNNGKFSAQTRPHMSIIVQGRVVLRKKWRRDVEGNKKGLENTAAPNGAVVVADVKIDFAASASDTRSTSFARRTRYICGFVPRNRSKIKLVLHVAKSVFFVVSLLGHRGQSSCSYS